MTSAELVAQRREPWAVGAERALRTLAPVTVAAVGLSVLIGGVGGRLAMALLAGTNPENEGRISDDGFVIGRFDVGGTVQLLGFSFQVGLVAATLYLVARHLVFGPRWFQVVSMAVGAGVVVGAVIVHPDGVDFTLFDPPLLAIALFVAIPVVYVGCLALLAERLIDSAWAQTSGTRTLAVVTFVIWAIGAFTLLLLPVVVAIWACWHLVESTPVGTAVRSQTTRWLARALLALVFVAGVTNLVDDASALV